MKKNSIFFSLFVTLLVFGFVIASFSTAGAKNVSAQGDYGTTTKWTGTTSTTRATTTVPYSFIVTNPDGSTEIHIVEPSSSMVCPTDGPSLTNPTGTTNSPCPTRRPASACEPNRGHRNHCGFFDLIERLLSWLHIDFLLDFNLGIHIGIHN